MLVILLHKKATCRIVRREIGTEQQLTRPFVIHPSMSLPTDSPQLISPISPLLPRIFCSNRVLCPQCLHTQAGSACPRTPPGEVSAEPSSADPSVKASASHSRRPRLCIGSHPAPCAQGSRSRAGRWASAGGRAPLRYRPGSAWPGAPPWLLSPQIPSAARSPRSYPEALPFASHGFRVALTTIGIIEMNDSEDFRFLWRHLAATWRHYRRGAPLPEIFLPLDANPFG